jgi:HEAT repeat protein
MMLCEALKQKDYAQANETVQTLVGLESHTLERLGPKMSSAAVALGKNLREAEKPFRVKILAILASMKETGSAATPEVLECLDDEDSDVQLATLKTLAALSARDEKVVKALGKASKNRDDVRALAAIKGLVKAGQSAHPVLEDLIAALERSEKIREAAVDALVQIGKPAAKRLGNAVVAHPSVPVRVAAADALGKIGPDAVEALPQLNEAMRSRQREVREAAKRAWQLVRMKKE